jgi:undecaprenyl pyrophosphate phosphatase UppP
MDIIARVLQLGAYILIFLFWGYIIGLLITFSHTKQKNDRDKVFMRKWVIGSAVLGALFWFIDILFGVRFSVIGESFLVIPYLVLVFLIVGAMKCYCS